MKPKVHIEHPDDWNMHEAAFAKACSQLGYRLLSLADKTQTRGELMTLHAAATLERIKEDVHAIGG